MLTNKYNLILLFAGLIFWACSSQQVAEEDILAVVNGQIISKEDFVTKYEEFKKKSSVAPNGQIRRGILTSLIEDKILVFKAQQKGFNLDSLAIHESEKIKIQQLLNQYNQNYVLDKSLPSEEELQLMYRDFNTRIKARHLFSETKEGADSLYRALQKGASFDELARKTFRDPRLKKSGGSLGYFSIDEMDPAFEKAVFAMNIGELSKPVRTKNGFSIIEVEDSERAPFLTEYDFSTNKEKISNYMQKRSAHLNVQAFVDSLSDDLDIRFNEPELMKQYNLLKQNDRMHKFSPSERERSELKNNSEEKLVSFDGGSWNIADLRKKARFTTEQQQKWIKNPFTFKKFISGLIVRDKILELAKENKIDRTSEFESNIKRNFETFLMQRMSADLVMQMEVPDDSVDAYYKANAQQFALPRSVNLRELLVTDKTNADLIAKKLQSGQTFLELAEKYATNKNRSGKVRETGFLTSKELGKWSKLVFSLKEGDWVGPLAVESSFVFLQCIQQKASELRLYSQVKDEVEMALKAKKWQDFRTQKLNEYKSDFQITAYPEKLRGIVLN